MEQTRMCWAKYVRTLRQWPASATLEACIVLLRSSLHVDRMLCVVKLKSYWETRIFQGNPTQGVELPPDAVNKREVSNATWAIGMRTRLLRFVSRSVCFHPVIS
jgi:hypothetical protein